MRFVASSCREMCCAFSCGATVMLLAGCGATVTDVSDWPVIGQLQLTVNSSVVRAIDGRGVSGPIPVLRLGENPVSAYVRGAGGAPRTSVVSPEYALVVMPGRFAPLAWRGDSTNTMLGRLTATELVPETDITVMIVHRESGRIHYGPFTVAVAVAY